MLTSATCRRGAVVAGLFLITILLLGGAVVRAGALPVHLAADGAVPTVTSTAALLVTATISPTVAPVASPSLTVTIMPTPTPLASSTVVPLPASATPLPSATSAPGWPTVVWASPNEHSIMGDDSVVLAVRVSPRDPGQRVIDHVTFWAAWPREADVPASQAIACTARPPATDVPVVASCAWNVRAAGVPNGPLVISALVVDSAGRPISPTLDVRHGLVAQPVRKAIVLLEGVCTALDQGPGTTNTTFTALQNLLKTPAYHYADTDFLVYSYKGGILSAQGKWVHRAYGLSDPIHQNFHATSWSALHDQLLVPYHRRHPNTTFVLVGHSLGGMVAWEELKREMAVSTNQRALLSAVMTIDSPLHGISGPTVLLANIVRLDPQIGNRLDCALRGQAVNVLLAVHRALRTAKDLVTLANRAVQRGIAITTVGNAADCVWAPNRCGVPVASSAATQWISGSRAHALIFTIPRPCTRREAYCFVGTHGAVLTNTNGPQALRQIAATLGPQVAPHP